MANFDLNLVPTWSPDTVGDSFDLAHGDFDLNLVPTWSPHPVGQNFTETSHADFDLNLRAEWHPHPDGINIDGFTHGDFDLNLILIGGETDPFPPEVQNIDPAPGTNIADNTPIEFDVFDEKFIRLVAIAVLFPDGTADLAYDGFSLQGNYSASPNLVADVIDPNGLRKHFRLLRAGGWIGNPTFKYLLLDRFNNGVIA